MQQGLPPSGPSVVVTDGVTRQSPPRAGVTTRCVIYRRVSGRRQEDGESLDTQLREARRYAATMGWEVVEECQDVKSGLLLTREGYQRVLELARRRKIDAVLVWRLDRFGRDDGEAISRGNELDRLKVELHSVTQGRLDSFTRNILFSVARQESKNTSERVLPNIRSRAEQGLWTSRPPYGYRMVKGQPGVMEVYEPEARLVREAFRRAANGESIYSIAGWLNSLPGVTARHGGYFTHGYLKNLLRSPAYIGMVHWNKRRNSKIDGHYLKDASEHVLVPGRHEALVTREIFDAVQAHFGQGPGVWKGGKAKGIYLLTHIVRCGECGNGMYGNWFNYSRLKRLGRPPQPGDGFQYKCNRKGHIFVNGKRLDAYVLGQLSRLSVGAEDVPNVRAILERAAAQEPDRTRELQAARNKQMERRKSLTLYLADGTLTSSDYRAAIEEIDQALTVLERELAALEPARDIKSQIDGAIAWLQLTGDVAGVLETATLEEKAGLVAGAIERVEVHSKTDPPVIVWRPWAELLLRGAALVGEVI